MQTYITVKGYDEDEFIEKRSRFIGYIKHVETEKEATDFIAQIRQKHWDATHNVYAYSLRENQVKRYSDDNEPQGTAGIPVLDVLQKNNVVDAVIVVTRYFGGVLLGAGGLVRAYSHGASIALKKIGTVTMQMCSVCELSCTYTQYGRIPATIASFDGVVDDSEFTDAVRVKFHIPCDNLKRLNEVLSELSCGECSAKELSKSYFEQKKC
ncbi:MAG: YigZ family protein [Ruminococcus sp.]|nr:YigZ family protein [Ruminococcus sp.]